MITTPMASAQTTVKAMTIVKGALTASVNPFVFASTPWRAPFLKERLIGSAPLRP